MIPLIKWLREGIYFPVASCCGHGKYPMTIVVKYEYEDITRYFELFSNIELKRTKRFYRRDKQGYYFIPEVVS